MTTEALVFWGLPLLSFGISALSLPLIIRLARHYNVVANPHGDSDERHPTPLLGGLSIITAILVALALAGALPWWMVIGAAGLCAVGTLDDIRPLRPRSKFLMQV